MMSATAEPTADLAQCQREIELVKTELIAKFKSIGIGAGLLAGAALVLYSTYMYSNPPGPK